MEFFNRSEETLKLSSLFQFPTWTIILGPPSSGKTALVNHVVNQQRKDGSHMFIPVMIDFRECTPTSGDDIRDMLIRSLNRSSLIREIFSKLDIEISAALSGLGIKLSKSPRSQKISLLDHIKRLAMKKRPKESVNLEMFLAILKEALLGFRKLILRRGETHTAPLVLVFDEVNVLRELEDKHALKEFIRFITMITKQMNLVHVIFTSSDSFFTEWLQNTGVTERTAYRVATIGDLDRKQSYEYYLFLIRNAFSSHPAISKCLDDENSFDKMYLVTGGRIHLINEYFRCILSNCKFDVEIGVLEAFLNTVALGVRNEKFKADHVWVVISAIVKSEFGYFSYRSLKGQLGESLNRMITDNLFYLRHPFDNWSSDIGDLTESVVTAINKPALNALKDLSKEEFESSAK